MISIYFNKAYDAIVVGSGPNGLAAAITLAREGISVLVLEGKETIGGGARSKELTLPGFVHDVCSAIHPLGIGSPFFQSLPLNLYGLEWIQPSVPLAHPLDDGSAVLLERSVARTAAGLGEDAEEYVKLIEPLTGYWDELVEGGLGPLRPGSLRHPLIMARFGLQARRSVQGLVDQHFKGRRARALFAGLGAHSQISLDQPLTAAAALMLGVAGHTVGWPLPRGGSQMLTEALADYLRSLGGEIITEVEVKDLKDLPETKAVLCDVAPRQLLGMGASRFSSRYRKGLEAFRYGPGVFKIDLALDGPVPWTAPECQHAGTLHLGGSFEEIVDSERLIAQGRHPERPYVLVAQQSLFDPSRAPAGKQVLWAYCHVPNGSIEDMTARIEDQIERFAPGFRQRILARHTMGPGDYEAYNPNYIGGDINGGMQDLWQFFTRPVLRAVPYTTSAKNIYLCSSSTPPGGGVHGMCGYYCARAALHRSFAQHKQAKISEESSKEEQTESFGSTNHA